MASRVRDKYAKHEQDTNLYRGAVMAEIHNPKMPKDSDVELAIAALDGNANPLDMDMSDIDPDPTSLDIILPGKQDDRHAAAPR